MGYNRPIGTFGHRPHLHQPYLARNFIARANNGNPSSVRKLPFLFAKEFGVTHVVTGILLSPSVSIAHLKMKAGVSILVLHDYLYDSQLCFALIIPAYCRQAPENASATGCHPDGDGAVAGINNSHVSKEPLMKQHMIYDGATYFRNTVLIQPECQGESLWGNLKCLTKFEHKRKLVAHGTQLA